MSRGYQCFSTRERITYCSSYEVRNHDEGVAWVRAAMAHFGIQGRDLNGRPFLRDSPPRGAITWPDADDGVEVPIAVMENAEMPEVET